MVAFGFLGGREIANAGLGNLGLQDREFVYADAMILLLLLINASIERESFRWIKRHISAFGGDPNKVTM